MSSPTTSYIRPLAALVAMVALLIAYDASPARAEGVCSTTAATTMCTFDTTGTSAWTVPAGITQATFDVFGAQGGSQGPSAGGTGGEATATIPVIPGETLQVNVGGKGGDGAGSRGGAGGFNGGASGGDGCCDGSGGGGGASDVRRDTNASGDFALASRIIVAGGGGGRGGFSTRGLSAGGVGGGPSGGDGTGGSYGDPSLDGAPGGGGTQVAGGAGGGPAELWGVPGSIGALGTGGGGGAGLGNAGDGGGGGGGGYYGGGGGGGGMSAGGGGGGSGFGPNGVVFNSGVRSGNGLVTITYTTPDTTPPTLSVSHTADGSNGWNKTSPVTLDVSASDSDSGLAGAPTCKDGTTSLTLTVGSTAGTWTASVSGAGTHAISCSVTDNAGIRKSATDTVNIDTKAPTISDLGPTASANANGWYNTDVTNRFRATDSLSGVNVSGLNAACVAAFPADQADQNVQSKRTSGEGSSVKVTSDGCTDVAGNTAKGIDSATFQIDKTKPTIVVASAKKADSSAYKAGTWSNQSVTVSYTCSDEAGSGVASCPVEQTFSEDGADQSASGTTTDNAGNTASVTFGDIDIDRTRPRVTCDVPSPTFVLGGSGANVRATVTDATSGQVSDSLSGAVNVSSVGNKNVSLTGTDNAGNSTTLGCPYTVKYGFLGPFSPIPQSTYNAGSTIPVKFALADASGKRISDATARALLASPCKVKVSLGAGTKNCVAYDAATDTFQYNLKVPKNLPSGPYTIVIEVSAPDGSGVVNKESVEVNIRR